MWGWDIALDARVGLSFVDATRVVLGKQARIGHFNVARHLTLFELGPDASLINFNVISGSPYDDWPRAFQVGESGRVRSNHYFDCGGGIFIGEGTSLAGRDIQVWTHNKLGPSVHDETFPSSVHIGAHTYVGARSILTPGCRVGARTMIAAGSVVAGDLTAFEGHLLAGVPARSKGPLKEKRGHPLSRPSGI